MAAARHEIRWVAPKVSALKWRSWGEAHYAFDPRSHQTHFLNTLAVEVLDELAIQPRSLTEIYEGMLERYHLTDDPALLAAIESTLVVLDHLGLVTRFSDAPVS